VCSMFTLGGLRRMSCPPARLLTSEWLPLEITSRTGPCNSLRTTNDIRRGLVALGALQSLCPSLLADDEGPSESLLVPFVIVTPATSAFDSLTARFPPCSDSSAPPACCRFSISAFSTSMSWGLKADDIRYRTSASHQVSTSRCGY